MWSKNELLRLSHAEIKKLIESGEITNAKPIYFHPIRMQVSATLGGNIHRINCSICVLNNSSTPFTYATLSKWVYDNDIKLIADGPVVLGTDDSFAGTVSYWSKYNEEGMNINWVKANGVGTTGSIAPSEIIAFDDSGVNKIN